MYDKVKIEASFQDSFLGWIVSSPARALHSAVTGTVLCSWESLGLVGDALFYARFLLIPAFEVP